MFAYFNATEYASVMVKVAWPMEALAESEVSTTTAGSTGTTHESATTKATGPPGGATTTTGRPTLPGTGWYPPYRFLRKQSIICKKRINFPWLPAGAKILLAPTDGGLQIYSLESSSVKRIGDAEVAVHGVAHDAKSNKIFWYDYNPDNLKANGFKSGARQGQFKPYTVYSADGNGNGVQILQSKVNLLSAAILNAK